MSLLRDLLDQVVRSALPRRRSTSRRPESPRRDRRGRTGPRRDDDLSPGQAGPYATTQAHQIGPVRTSYHPNTNGDPDPGEIVWTWVPYEENDGRGKDRPVLIVAAEPSGTLLAVQLSSRDHSDDREWVPVGSGTWDDERRPSWADTDRVLRLHPLGMRREATALDRDQFDAVIAALNDRHHWQ
ncbi:MAG TPA: type II toxin-antitoxin system PemK/MazF family toxin [Jiangellaceae bacterium]|nr:type II toxin-antitoxin system PemK/MazF family toxin [Jiangellaceae bacterium]